MRIRNLILGALCLAASTGRAAGDDPYLWLSNIHGREAQAWVARQNARSDAILTRDSRYASFRKEILKSLDTKTRIPLGELRHGWAYNFWQDADHVRGLWRRATVADYRNPHPRWDVLLDVDKYDAARHRNWVFHGADCAPSERRCLVRLSPGGGDADEVFEYEPAAHDFAKDGFHLGVAKSEAAYLDDDTIIYGTDFGLRSLTRSGYPRILKIWHRGRPLARAGTVFVAERNDVSAAPLVFRGPYGTVALIQRGLTFFTSEYFALRSNGAIAKLPLPLGAELHGVTDGRLIFTLRDAWTFEGKSFEQGSLLSFDVLAFLAPGAKRRIALLYAPAPHETIDTVEAGRDAVFAAVFANITGSIYAFRPGATGVWTDTKLDLPPGGTTEVVGADAWSPEAYFTYESFLVPPTLYEETGGGPARAIKAQAPLFDAGAMTVDQHWAVSQDGTRIPYFLVHAKNAREPRPTILYGYGGFELPLFPWYWNDGHRPLDAGQVWLSRGGTVAVANIRGGGEFGPAWHQAAMKLHHKRVFEDFAAVAKDLIARGDATPKTLGIVGASNGGLLVSALMVEHPELFAAVVCQRPLIDMLRYAEFGAGASWTDEYGDPADPAMRAYIAGYSPYQNVKQGAALPPVLFITETSDDRVTPVFARMMAAKMEAQGHDVLFNEAVEGGHGPGSTNSEQADMWTLSYAFLASKLGLGK